MEMTASLLAVRLGLDPGSCDLPDGSAGFQSIEYVLPETRFQPGRAYLLTEDRHDLPPGLFIVSSQTKVNLPGCTVLRSGLPPDVLYRKCLDILDEFRRLELDLQTMVEAELDLDGLIDHASRYLGNQLLIVDRSMSVLAVSHLEAMMPDENWQFISRHRRLPDEVVSRMAPLYQHSKRSAADIRQRLETGIAMYGVPNVHVDLVDRGSYLGWLIMVGNVSPITPGMADLLVQLAVPVSRLMKLLHAEAKPDLAFNDYYWQAWLEGQLNNRPLMQALLRDRGWHEEDSFRVTRFKLDDPAAVLRLRKNVGNELGLIDEGGLTLTERFPGGQPAAKPPLPVVNGDCLGMGISDICADINRLPVLYTQATIALEAAGARPERSCAFSDIAIGALLAGRVSQQVFLHPAACRLRYAGGGQGGKDLETLRVYLEYERQLTRAAGALFIHKNTLLYRIGRLTETLSLDLDSSLERQRLLLSLQILQSNPAL